MKKCILLVRASTVTQTVEDQKAELEKWAIEEGYAKEEQRKVIDYNESGYELSEEERLGIIEMNEYIKDNPGVDCVYAWNVSRIGRSLKVNASVMENLVKNKIQLKTKTDNIILLDEETRSLNKNSLVMYSFLSSMAQNGAQDIKANTIRGKARSMREGKSAHGKLLYGYTKDENGKIKEDVPKADNIRRIFREYVENDVAVVNIYRELADKGIFKEYTTERSGIARIRDILKNPSYCGEPHLKKKLKKKNAQGELIEKTRDLLEAKRYPAIITREQFDAAKDKLKQRISMPKVNTRYVYYAKGLIRYMGLAEPHKMVANRQTITYRVPDNLHHFSISINAIDSILWKAAIHLYVQMLTKSDEVEVNQLKGLYDDYYTKIATAQKQIDELNEKIKRAYLAYEDNDKTYDEYKERKKLHLGKIAEYENKIVKFKEQQERIAARLNHLGDDEWKNVDVTTIEEITDDVERKRIIDKVIDSIDIYPIENGEGCEIRIEQHINLLGYAHTYTYKSRGGRITLLRHTHKMDGEVITKDVSSDIIKRLQRNDTKGDRHKNRKGVVRTPTVDADSVGNP